ncbi:MAG: MTH1187 family thiamine-binding protein [Gemmatimonadetes bacterium]|nr:MTH1187 family thiamine-binding protein [Gemmatimonadota bacterium]MYH19309.1 MTH1187 family thiamine-binding protein [Gemmatimonadota bacterium]MYK98814.1 MTH1187 family thiamine-binding protein [Gemmatimonadota bacterium]
MKVIVDLCVVPIGVGVSVSEYVTACERVLREAGLKTFMHAYGTNIEGEWEEVFAAVRSCHETVHEMGAPRISTTIRLGTRTDRAQTMEEKIESVERKLNDETSIASCRRVR